MNFEIQLKENQSPFGLVVEESNKKRADEIVQLIVTSVASVSMNLISVAECTRICTSESESIKEFYMISSALAIALQSVLGDKR